MCYKLILSLHFVDEKQGNVIDGVSEVKIDASAAKKRGSDVTSDAMSDFTRDVMPGTIPDVT